MIRHHGRTIEMLLWAIFLPESSVVSAHVLGSLLLPLFSMNLPIQTKNMAALVTSTLHLPQANPKNKIPYTKLNSITENRKNQKKQKKPKIPEKGWGAHSCWIFVFFVFFGIFGFFSVFVFFFGGFVLYRLSIGVVLPWKCFLHISWTARPNFRFSGGGGSVCAIFFWARNTTLFSKEWTNIIYCILFKETCIKACCTVVSERATAYWRIPFQNNAIFPARNTILLQMAIPCIALYYRHITLFQRDCCIYERVPFCTTTYCKSHHTQPYSVTRTAVCLEGYFSKRCYILLKGRLWVTVYIYI